ncbi:MAG TPA: ATP-binding protein [Coleofasciculaceae cyanobacterium]
MKITEFQENTLRIRASMAHELSHRRTANCQNYSSIGENDEQPGLEQSKVCETPLKKIYLQVNTALNELDQVLQWFNQLEDLSIPTMLRYQCQLVLAEGFTNAVRHAHKNLPGKTPIDLEVTVFNTRLEIRIWDYGQPFDLEAKLIESRKIDREQLEREGGRGLIIMRRSADRLSYTRSVDERNCLVFVKYFLPA